MDKKNSNLYKFIPIGLFILFITGILGLNHFLQYKENKQSVNKKGYLQLHPLRFWQSLKSLNYHDGVITPLLEGEKKRIYDLNMLDGKVVRVGGFGIPLEVDKKVKRFLMVSDAMYCQHVPPPPPNQIVKVIISDDQKFEGVPYEIFGDIRPFWVTGKFKVLKQKTEYGHNAFIIEATNVEEIKYNSQSNH